MASTGSEHSDDQPDSKEEDETASMSSWFSGWYDTAKKKLAETNEFMKHDLQEFSQAVHTDASRIVAATATTMKEKLNINVDLEEASAATRVVKDSLSNFLGNIASKVGPIRPEDDDNFNESAIVGTSSGTKVLSPSEARLYAIRTDPATFCNEPDNEEEFHSWSPSFNLEDRKTEISSLMLDCSKIRSLYTKLVPTAVSHCDFWQRYYFKLHQHDKAEARRAMLVERAQKKHDDIGWEDDEDDWVQPKNIPENIPVSIVKNDEESQKHLETETLAEERSSSANTNSNMVESLDSVAHAEKTKSKNEALPQILPELKDFQTNSQSPIELNSAKSESMIEQSPNDISSEKLTTTVAEKIETETNQSSTPEKKSDNSAITNTAESDKTAPTGKVPSSGESSDDWEKDFDLDMTEDEIQQALKESDAVDVDIGEDWDDWE